MITYEVVYTLPDEAKGKLYKDNIYFGTFKIYEYCGFYTLYIFNTNGYLLQDWRLFSTTIQDAVVEINEYLEGI